VTTTDQPTEPLAPFAPTVIELPPALTVESATSSLAHLTGCLLLQSAMKIPAEDDPSQTQPLGRYSFLMADPVETVVEPIGSGKIFTRLKALLEKYKTQTVDDLPPMQGGLAGLFSYELSRSIERVGPPICDEFQLPAIAVGAYDVVIAWDHQLDTRQVVDHFARPPGRGARSQAPPSGCSRQLFSIPARNRSITSTSRST